MPSCERSVADLKRVGIASTTSRRLLDHLIERTFKASQKPVHQPCLFAPLTASLKHPREMRGLDHGPRDYSERTQVMDSCHTDRIRQVPPRAAQAGQGEPVCGSASKLRRQCWLS